VSSPRRIDPGTLTGKLILGYQGWFSCEGDGSPLNAWNHWTRDRRIPDASNIRVEMWPDLSEYDPDELYATNLRYPDGSVASLYSAWNLKTVMRHFRWMRDYNLDGAFHYRFINAIPTSQPHREFRNRVLENIRQAAEANERVFAVMYDISDYTGPSVVDDIKGDWIFLVDSMRITESAMYQRHKGKPVLVLRNLGMKDGTRLMTPQEATDLIAWFKAGAAQRYQTTLLGALPGYWRTLGRDVKVDPTTGRPDPAWATVFRSFDIVSGWPVGRFGDEAGADAWLADVVWGDMQECARLGIDYMPAVYPGYSYHNADPAKIFNDKRRVGGRFYWRQVRNLVSANATMIYNAIFDEVDEASAMYKVSPRAATQPVLTGDRRFLSLDTDGEALPSDWYLRLADYAGRTLRKEIPLSETRPIDP
jgi:hypothetical protein